MFELHKRGKERKVRSRLGTSREGEERLGQGWAQTERERES